MTKDGRLETTRRNAIAGLAAGVGIVAGIGTPAVAQTARKTFVLVHGSWHGGWCWRRVADLLEKNGHKVYAPTLTGLGERSHLMSGLITLDTHITDVANVIKWENLDNVVLVGHSYAGFVVSGVAEKALPSISSIVFLDAFLPDNGQRVVDLAPPELKANALKAAERNEVGRPVPPAKTFYVNEKDQGWVDTKMTPQPTFVSLQPIVLTGAREKIAKKTYIRATSSPSPVFDSYLEKLKSDPAWRTYSVPCGHDVMVDMPERLCEILIGVS
ncbi:MAG: alpha/beta hydrolase [Xanthobacteraceae bacterium]|nr:alpha/beta hydrolase [Xanthobacteraceae bacterium]MBV9632968.1 alpha/beta hydrolase [Xanthobacteraceae bacterium]